MGAPNGVRSYKGDAILFALLSNPQRLLISLSLVT